MNIITTPIANNTLTIASFLTGATLSSILIGWLVKTGSLPLKTMMAYSEWQLQFIRVWVKIALVIGVIVPFVLLITSWSNSIVRQFLVSYIIVVVVQLTCEASCLPLACQKCCCYYWNYLHDFSAVASLGGIALNFLHSKRIRFIMVSYVVLDSKYNYANFHGYPQYSSRQE